MRRHDAHDGKFPQRVENADPHRTEVYQRILHLVAGDLLVDADADVWTPRKPEQKHQQKRHNVTGVREILA